MKPVTNIKRFPWRFTLGFPSPSNGLRAVAERAPEAEALAASWIARAIKPTRPFAIRLYTLRRRIATVAVAVLTVSLLMHVMFGANGMVAFRQKRADYEALRRKIGQAQLDNDRYTRQIQSLKTDEKAIEKEAREQLGYAKPGEYVYVQTPAVKPTPPANHSAKK